MKVKINKEGKVKEFKLIDKWEDVTIETYSKLMTFTNGTKSSEALATLTELSNIPKELLNQLELKHIVLMLEKLSHLQSQEDTTLKNIIEIDGVRYGFHPDFDEMTLGEYADIESFIKSGADKHLPEIMAVLYRPIKEEVDGVYTIEAYDGNIKIRTEIMRKMSATQVHSALVFFYHFSNVLLTIMQLSLMEVLQEINETLNENDRNLMKTSLFLGIEMDPLKDDPQQGDFLIRNLMGVDHQSGALAIGAMLREGQLVQFHLRDKVMSAEDLDVMLSRYHAGGKADDACGALLFSCLGRGQYLYGRPNHDTDMFKDKMGAIPLGGFFCNGEIGPVGKATFLHGYTSSFGIFRPQSQKAE